MIAEFQDGLDTFSRTYVSKTAERLEATVPCVPCGADDYAQELQWNLIRRQPRFDPTRGRWTSFVRLVTDHRAGELKHRCLKGRCQALLFRPIADLSPDSTIEVMARDENETPVSLQMDVNAWLAALEEKEQQLCRALMRGSVSEAAMELQIPRSTAHEVISRLRRRFERTSLRDYARGPKSIRRVAPRDR